MKKQLRTTAILCLLCIALGLTLVSAAVPNNLVANAGFEEEGGWLTFLDEATFSESGDPVFDGNKSFKLAKDHNGVKNLEKIPFVAGGEYALSYQTYGKSMFLIGLYTAKGNFIDYQYTDFEAGTYGEWTEVTGTLILDNRDDVGFFDVQILNREESGNIFLDNVALTSAAGGAGTASGTDSSTDSDTKNNNPKTGDGTQAGIAVCLMILSAAALTVCKKSKKSAN